MKTGSTIVVGLLGLLLAVPALGQTSSSITTTPDGRLVGSATAGGAPPVSVEAGGGRTRIEGGYSSPEGSGRSVNVEGPNSSASAGAWTSGGGRAAVYGTGPAGSDVQYRSYGRPEAYAYDRRHHHHHHRRWRRRD